MVGECNNDTTGWLIDWLIRWYARQQTHAHAHSLYRYSVSWMSWPLWRRQHLLPANISLWNRFGESVRLPIRAPAHHVHNCIVVIP